MLLLSDPICLKDELNSEQQRSGSGRKTVLSSLDAVDRARQICIFYFLQPAQSRIIAQETLHANHVFAKSCIEYR